MLVGGDGSRISHHLRECNHRHQYYRDPQQALAVGLGFCSSRIGQLSSLIFKPESTAVVGGRQYHRAMQPRTLCFSSLRSKSPGETPILSDCFRWVGIQKKADDFYLCKAIEKMIARTFLKDCPQLQPLAVRCLIEISCYGSLNGLESFPDPGGIVALGKFDALHIGHRELAIQASKVGVPYLLSFVGMAEVLGWEPRPPIVAKCDRHRVLSSWAPHCGNIVPAEFQVEFSNVRHLTPRQFVEKLCKELEVAGVVAGENYRFGYKAAGDTSELLRLCNEHGIQAYIINSVMDKHPQDPSKLHKTDSKDKGQVSSTRVRHALAAGDMDYVAELLGRRHRLIVSLEEQNWCASDSSRWKVSAQKSRLLNLPPKDGAYVKCYLFLGDKHDDLGVPCRVTIDSTSVHLEVDEDAVGFSDCGSSHRDLKLVGIEFGD
ncbi:unnamed protein product [Linum tenue]|uniref:FAD synthase n=1 Tax=Linum tenue TaxID=586396 RepID=A0AAV0ME13_9ROSI|nr:unnamed protein product [Linum tenue]